MVDEAQFENIFEELKKIQQLEESDVQLRVMYGNQKDEINQVKSELGLDEGETVTDKKNVIGGQDAPSRLTSNERNRYKNIGRAFVEGASQSFKNIQKAIKFKENMSTIKNKFFSGIDKIKTGIKNAVGSGDFWKKLLKIIGLLSIIVYLYKEKFSKKFPDLSESVGELFGGLKRYFGGLVSNIYDFVVQGISRSFESILNKAFLYIPSIIDTFFGYTLPTAITNLYLEVLSIYGSDSAQEELNKRLEDSTKRNTEVVTGMVDVAERYVENQNKVQFSDDFSEAYYEILDLKAKLGQSEGEIGAYDKFKTLSENAGIFAFESVVDNKKIGAVIAQSARETLGIQRIHDLDLAHMMRQNNFNMNVFASEIKQFLEDEKLTRGEVIEAIRSSVSDEIFSDTIEEYIENLKADKNYLDQSVEDTDILGAKTAFQNFIKTYDSMREQYNNAAKKSRVLQDQYDQEILEKRNKFKPVIIEIDSTNVGNVIKDALVGKFGSVIESISNFIKGDSLKIAITKGLESIGNFYSQYFNSSIQILNNALSTGSDALEEIINRTNAIDSQTRQQSEESSTTTNNQSENNEVKLPTSNHLNNNVIVNINLNSGESSIISSLIGQLNNSDNKTSEEIQKSNEHLGEILKLVKGVNQITGVTEQFVEEKCGELKKTIEALKTSTTEVVKQTNNRIGSLGNTVNELVNSSMPYITSQIQQVSGFA